jgi:hypothetical protein
MTTLTAVSPLARSSWYGDQPGALIVRYVDHASTAGDIPV